jgi:mannose-1-phosphate guanylyltransferase
MENQHTYVAIMAGGVGSRFWPASRERQPKQFLDILGIGKSLLRITFERFLHLVPASNILIVTNEIYKDLVLEHIPEISPEQILCEPSRNNTAPCITYTALKLKAKDPNAVFVVAPSDHIILKEQVFVDNIRKAVAFANSNNVLVTLGIEPTRPDTGYGYINYVGKGEEGLHKVKRFTEKPDLDTARFFVSSGEYLWNAGIFVWKVDHLLAAMGKYANRKYWSKGMNFITPHKRQILSKHITRLHQIFPSTMPSWKRPIISTRFHPTSDGRILALGRHSMKNVPRMKTTMSYMPKRLC